MSQVFKKKSVFPILLHVESNSQEISVLQWLLLAGHFMNNQ